jgi:hypothetical protein
MSTPKRKPARVLTQLKINEVSSVDVGAAHGAKVMLMKRHDRNAAFAQLMNQIFGVRKRQPFNPPWEKNLDVTLDPDEPINPRGAKEPAFPPPDDVLDDDDEATDNEEERQMKRAEELSALGKRYGITAIAKRIVEKGDVPINEAELTSMMSEHCAANNTSFAKRFTAQDAEGILWRKAIEACKHAAWINASGAR